MDKAHSEGRRGLGIDYFGRLAIDLYDAGVGMVEPGQDADKGRLASAIGAHQTVYFAR